jgi:ankyrin repeat protein
MDMETGIISPDRMRTEEYLLQSGVGLITLETTEQLILPVHSTARDFVFSNSARRQFELMSTEPNSKESWPFCINAGLWSERTFRSALGSLCLSTIEQGTSLEVGIRPKPARMAMPQPEIPRFWRLLMPLKGGRRAAEISINPSAFKRPALQPSAKASLQYAIDNWLACNRTIASDSIAFPWMAQINRRTNLQTNEQLFERVAKGRNDSFSVHPWPAFSGSLNSHMMNMFAYAVANDHVPLLRVVKRNRKSLPLGVFDRPIPEHGEMLAIHVATRKGFTGIINELLDICNVSRVCRSTGENVLHFAAKTGERDHVMTFLGIPAVIVNLKDNNGRTPLHLAAKDGREAVVKLLLETARVEVNLTDKSGETPLQLAARYGREAVVELLLETARVEVNLTDKSGETPLHFAASNDNEAVVKLLLETARVEVNLKDNNGRTPLHLAARYGREAAVKLLLDTARVEVNLTDRNGRTARDLAAEAGYKKVAELIRR